MTMSEENIMKVEKFDFSDKKAQKWVKSVLAEGQVTVKFTKKDGSLREMNCTLHELYIPSEKMPKGTGKTENSEVLAVFDVEKMEWRSFRWDSINEVIVSLE
jgi:hypothetical protein